MSIDWYQLGQHLRTQQQRQGSGLEDAQAEAIERGYMQNPNAVPQPDDRSSFRRALGYPLGVLDSTVNPLNEASILSRVLEVGNKYVTRPVVGAAIKANTFIGDHIPLDDLVQLHQRKSESIPGPQEGALGWINPLNWIAAPFTIGQSTPAGRSIARIMVAGQDPEKRERLDQAKSFTEYYNIATEGEGTGRFVIEAVLDPLNLAAGAGAVGKAAKGARAAGQLRRARALEGVASGLRLTDDIQALPITAPIAGLRNTVGRIPLVQRALDRAPIAKAISEMRMFQRGVQRAEERGIDATRLRPDATNIDVVNSQEQLRRLSELAEGGQSEELLRTVRDIRSGELGRLLVELPRPRGASIDADNATTIEHVRAAIQSELRERGELRYVTRKNEAGEDVRVAVPSPRLQRHIELSRIGDQYEWSAFERDWNHKILDAAVVALRTDNPQLRYDDIYSRIRIVRMQSEADDVLRRGALASQPDGTFILAISPEANVTTLPHELLGHLFRRGAGEATQDAIRARLGLPRGADLSIVEEERIADAIEQILFEGGELADNLLNDLGVGLNRYAEYAQFDYFRHGVPNADMPWTDRLVGNAVVGRTLNPVQRPGQAQTQIPGIGEALDPARLVPNRQDTIENVPSILPPLQDRGRGTFRSMGPPPEATPRPEDSPSSIGEQIADRLGLPRPRLPLQRGAVSGISLPAFSQTPNRPDIAALTSPAPASAAPSVDEPVRQGRFAIPGEGAGGGASPEAIRHVADLEQLDIDSIRVEFRDEELYPTERLIDLYRASIRPLHLGPDTSSPVIDPVPAYTPGKTRKKDIKAHAKQDTEFTPTSDVRDSPSFQRGESFSNRSLEGVTRAGTRPQGASRSGRAAVIRAIEEELGRRLGQAEMDRLLSDISFSRRPDADHLVVERMLSNSTLSARNLGNVRRQFRGQVRKISDRQLDLTARELMTRDMGDRRNRALIEEVQSEYQRRYGRTAGSRRMYQVLVNQPAEPFQSGPEILFQGDGAGFEWDDLFADFDDSSLPQRIGGRETTPLEEPIPLGDTRPAAPYSDATPQQVIDRIAVEVGADLDTADRVHAALAPVIERNSAHFQALELWNNREIRKWIEAAMTDPDNFDQHIRTAVEAMGDFWSSLGMQHPFFDTLVQTARKLGAKPSPRRSKASGRTRSPSALRQEEAQIVAEGLKMEPVREIIDNHNQMLDNVNATLMEIPGAAPITGLTTWGDVMRMRALANTTQRQVIDDYIKTFKLDLDKLDEQELADLSERTIGQALKGQIFDAHRTAVMKKFGIDPDKRPRGLLGDLMAAWREQALLSPRYHFANILDMQFKSTIEGVGIPVIGDGAEVYAIRRGIQIPSGVDTDPFFSRPEFATGALESQTGMSRVPILRDVLDAEGTVTVRGRELPRSLIKLNQQLARAIENSYRRAAWMKGMDDHLAGLLPRFHEDVRQAAMRAGVDEATANEIVEALATQGTTLSRQQLLDGIVARGGNQQMANDVANIWSRYLDEASDVGIDTANRIHFDYDDTRNIEEWLHLSTLFGFHFWMSRNIPYYVQTFAQNPWLLRFWDAYNDASEQELEESGLAALNRIQGMIPLGNNPVLSALLGDGMIWFNPMVIMSVTEHARPRHQEDTDNPLGQALNVAGQFGIVPAPWIMVPLEEFTDVLGEDTESMDILRHTGLLRETIGVDPERYTTRPLLNFIRENVFNRPRRVSQTESQYKDYLVSRRIAEMAVEAGRPNDPAYVDAQANPDSVIYQQALRDVERYLRGRAIGSFLFPLPFGTVSPGEQQVRAAQSQLPEGIPPWLAVRHGLISETDPAAGFLYVNADPRRRQINAGFDAIEYLTSGPYGNAVRRQAMERYPEFGAYLAWLQAQPDGVDATIEDYLATR